MRTLATIREIKEVLPIAGKDRIKLATFTDIDFKVIVDLSYQPGNRVVYFEMDTLLPKKPEYEFLTARCWNEKWQGHRIKCMRFKDANGAYVFSEGLAIHYDGIKPIGTDVSDEFEVRKYDPEAKAEMAMVEKTAYPPIIKWFLRFAWVRKLFGITAKSANPFPKGIGKSDQTRYQVLPYIYETFKNFMMYYTIKMDGQSLTAMKRGHRYYLASRNVELGIRGTTNYHKVWDKYKLKDVLDAEMRRTKGHSIAIQGESCGPGIQGNKYGFTTNEFFVFDVKDVTDNRYYNMHELIAFCERYNLSMVKVIEVGDMKKTPAELQALANKLTYQLDGKVLPHEGMVVRPVYAMEARPGMANIASFKVINEDFAVKYLEVDNV